MMHRTTWVRRGIAEMAVAAPLALAPMLPRTMHAAEAGVATPGGHGAAGGRRRRPVERGRRERQARQS
jgi:hypothetical protein